MCPPENQEFIELDLNVCTGAVSAELNIVPSEGRSVEFSLLGDAVAFSLLRATFAFLMCWLVCLGKSWMGSQSCIALWLCLIRGFRGREGSRCAKGISFSFRAVLEEAKPSLVTAAVGQNIQLVCKTGLSPFSRVEWMKDGRPVSSGR